MIRRLIPVLTLLSLVSGCGSDDPDRQAARTTTTYAEDARDVKGLVEGRYGDALQGMGLRLTRAAVVKRVDFVGRPPVDHLAVYVEPVGASEPATYVDRIEPITKLFLPSVFAEFSEIQSFDVCQEPPPGVDDGEDPKPYTQLFVRRDQSAAIEWRDLDLVGIVAGAIGHPNTLTLSVREPVSASPEWVETRSQAALRVGASAA